MICPRCDSDQAFGVHTAEDKSWEIYRCPRCNFNWRSTEPKEITSPEIFNSKFKLNQERIDQMAPKPPIPPLRREIGQERTRKG